ncbi:MAG: LPS export ABC transporter permease LptG [Gemmatimonadota bacterium]
MTRLDRYLLQRYVLHLGYSMAALLALAVVVDLTQNIDTFIDHQAALGQIVRYYLFRAPYWIILTLPVAVLLGTLFTLTGLARRSEITAVKAAGISLYRFLAPLFAFGLAFGGLAFVFTDLVVPPATFRYNSIRNEIRAYSRSDGSRRQVLLQDVDGQVIFARSFDYGRERAHDVLWEQASGSRVVARATAERLDWQGDHWSLVAGRRYDLEDGLSVAPFESLRLDQLTLGPADLARQQKVPEEMSFGELAAYIDRARANGEDVTRDLVDLHLKVAFPLTCFVILLLGAPVAAGTRRSSRANTFGVGVLVCFVFYSCVKAGQALGWNGLLEPWLGAWAANLLFGALGLVLLWRAHK